MTSSASSAPPPSDSPRDSTGGMLTGAKGLIAVVLLAVLAAWATALFTGASKASELLDPGAAIRWTSLLASPVADVAMAATLGLTAFGAFVVPEGAKTMRVARTGMWAGRAGALWFVAAVVGSYVEYGKIAGVAIGEPGYFGQWWTNTWSLEILRNPALTAIAALVIALTCWWHPTRVSMAWMTFLGVVALWPLALIGHAAGASDHFTAVDSLIMHIVPVSFWVGGLIALGLMWTRLGKGAAASVSRFSSAATWCLGFVAFSGLLASSMRVTSVGDYFTTRYGLVIVAKTVCLLLLAGLGLIQRRRVIAVLEKSPADRPSKALFARLASIELVIMGVTMGLASTLAQSAPPTGAETPSTDPVVAITGYAAPPKLTSSTFFSAWQTEWLLTAFAVVAIVQYLRWVMRLHKRGDKWPIHRSVLWVIAWLVFLWTVNGGPGVYGRVMMSVHMAGHMIYSMTVPVLLVLGAPITLMLRTWKRRTDGTMGPREVLLATVHSKYVNVLANPAAAGALFFIGLIVFYYTPIFELALRTHTGHMLMVIHFMWSGYLFAWSLIGIDPGPKKWPAPIRLLVLLITITFHAFFGVAMMTGETLLAPSFYEGVNYLSDPLRDQQAAGTITWGSGEPPTLLLAMMVAAQWARSDKMEGRRAERQAERDGDAELNAYNDYLQKLNR